MAIKEVELDKKDLKMPLALQNEVDATLHQVGTLEDKKLMLLKRVSDLRAEINKQKEFISQRFIEEGVIKVNIDVRGGKAIITTKDDPEKDKGKVTPMKKKKGKKKK